MRDIPDSWAVVELRELVSLKTGPFGSSLHESDYVGHGIPIINPMHIESGRISPGNKHRVSAKTAERLHEFKVQLDDIVIGRRGEMGRCAVVKEREAGWLCGTGSLIVRGARGLSANFLQRYLSSNAVVNYLLQASVGSTMANLNQEVLMAVAVNLPPTPEQTRIVDKLEELLSDLDAGVAELKAAQKKLAQYRQSLLKAAVEGQLTEAWRGQNGETEESGAQLLARILRERRARWEAKQLARFEAQGKAPIKGWQSKYLEPVVPGTAGLESLPSGWARATIDQLTEVGTGVTPLRSKALYFQNGTIPWVTSGALNDEFVNAAKEHVTELAVKECRLELYPSGSLLVAMYGEGKTRGKCAELLLPATINQAIAALVFQPEASRCKDYVKTFLLESYELMREQASGGVQPNLNLQILKSIALPLPPLAEQSEIAAALAESFARLQQQSDAVQHSLRQSAAQRKNILQAAFSGQLVPQDPNDEPASVLLARIRAEREGRPAKSRKPRTAKASA